MLVDRLTGSTAAEIVDAVRAAIADGGLAPGETLPTMRAAAEHLGVNRNTVAAAYAQLAAIGAVESHGRRGTVVAAAAELPGEGRASREGAVNLADGNPDPLLLPPLPPLAADAQPVLYGAPPVHPRLEAIARAQVSGSLPDGHRITVAGGAVDAIERLLSSALVRGEAVAVEDPGFLSHAGILRLHGLRPIGVAIDAEGPRPDALREALRSGAQAVILTPRAQNPTGSSISAERAELLRAELAAHPDVLVVEDDHYAGLAGAPYARSTPPGARRWALVRSVSKSLGPDLRVAMVHCDDETGALLDARGGHAVWVSHLLQRAVAAVLEAPGTQELLRAAREAYAERARMLTDALAVHGIAAAPHHDGVNVWLPLDGDEDAVVTALAASGWTVRRGADFVTGGGAGGGSGAAVRVTISTMTAERAQRFAAALAEALAAR